jgi:hypothetical protein
MSRSLTGRVAKLEQRAPQEKPLGWVWIDPATLVIQDDGRPEIQPWVGKSISELRAQRKEIAKAYGFHPDRPGPEDSTD